MTLEDAIRYFGGALEVMGAVMAALWIRERRLIVGDPSLTDRAKRLWAILGQKLGLRRPVGQEVHLSASVAASGELVARPTVRIGGTTEQRLEKLQRAFEDLEDRHHKLIDSVSTEFRKVRAEISSEARRRQAALHELSVDQKRSLKRDVTWDRRAVMFVAVGAVLTTFSSELASLVRAVT